MQTGFARVVATLALIVCSATHVAAQIPPTQVAATAQNRSLAEFEGRYQYRDGLTLYMVTSGEQLIAIIEQSKYLLRADKPDTFLNPAGDSIPFVRDKSGRIVAFKEYGEEFPRISTSVPALARLLLKPRTSKADGSSELYRYQAPPRIADGIEVGEAGPATLPRDTVEQLVNGVIDETYPDVRSILVHYKGALLLEEYFYGFDRDRPHGMRSFTKSVISLLVGAAIDRGLLRADEPAFGYLGYSTLGNPDPRKSKVTVAQLLSNQSGLACNEHDRNSPGNEVHLFETSDWVKTFVDLPMVSDPGTVARYCSGGFYAAGKVVERVTGKPLPEFAHEVLFAPLGIRRSQWQWNFTLDLSQRNEFGQIYVRPRDMLKLGLLVQARGQWQGKRVVSAEWIDAATARRSRVDDSDYGLGIWHRWYNVQTPSGERRVDTLMLSGNGGQKVYVVPSLDLIVVSTGSAYFVDSPVNKMMTNVLLPALMTRERLSQ
jgi:CubicO group peptidase (beta-lactamase class C family)